MKRAIKEKFIAELRNPKRRKTIGRLRSSNCFCALGILVDIHIKETKQKWNKINGYYFQPNDGSGHSLSFEVMEWAGIGIDQKEEFEDKIVSLNDCKGASFTEIADWIEENVKVVD